MLNVLTICECSSGRSQVACTYINALGSEYFMAECCGLNPQPLHPLVTLAMREDGYDIRNMDNASSVSEIITEDDMYDIVITVCNLEKHQLCHEKLGKALQLNWDYPDPLSFVGLRLDIMQQARKLRDGIKSEVIQMVDNYKAGGLELLQINNLNHRS